MHFDESLADRAVNWFSDHIQHVEGPLAGQPFVLRPWQAAHVGCAFGWLRDDGTRRYREVFDFEPRGNGKTAKAAGLVLYMMLCDGEHGAQVYSAAADQKQAGLIYRAASAMVMANESLKSRCRLYRATKAIEHRETIDRYQALTADADTKHGLNIHFVIVDELHAFHNRQLVDTLLTGMGKRRQPMCWHITTSDWDRESICNEKLDYAIKVRDGLIVDPSFLPIIYAAESGDDWTRESTWKKANPNYGVSVDPTFFCREFTRAQNTPAYESAFKRLHLNVKTQQDTRFFRIEDWDACVGGKQDRVRLGPHPATSDLIESLRGKTCYGGLDLSATNDTTALSLVFPSETGVDVVMYYWCPRSTAEERERKRGTAKYATWSDANLIELTDGNVVDYAVIRKRINQLAKIFRIKKIGIDRWNATQLSSDLAGDGISIGAVGQGFASMSGPMKELEKLILSWRIRHGGNPVTRWQADNLAVESDAAGNVKPTKKSSADKIDGMVAMIIGLAVSLSEPISRSSIYAQRGVIWV